MPITLTRLDPIGVDRAALIDFMTRNEFPFHVRPHSPAMDIEKRIDAGTFRDDDNDSYWIEHHEFGRIGIFRFEDLKDGNPMFDLRLDNRFRGHGLGERALATATDLIFSTMPNANRFEGQTRIDNIAMRKIFVSCGWLKEAHYREAWPVEGQDHVTTVGYSILRRDWESGRTSTFDWNDLETLATKADEELDATKGSGTWKVARESAVPEAVERLLSTVSEWFGLPDSNAEYIEAAKTMETWVARSDDGFILGVTLVNSHF